MLDDGVFAVEHLDDQRIACRVVDVQHQRAIVLGGEGEDKAVGRVAVKVGEEAVGHAHAVFLVRVQRGGQAGRQAAAVEEDGTVAHAAVLEEHHLGFQPVGGRGDGDGEGQPQVIVVGRPAATEGFHQAFFLRYLAFAASFADGAVPQP